MTGLYQSKSRAEDEVHRCTEGRVRWWHLMARSLIKVKFEGAGWTVRIGGFEGPTRWIFPFCGSDDTLGDPRDRLSEWNVSGSGVR